MTLAGVFKAFDSPMVDNKLWNIHKMIPISCLDIINNPREYPLTILLYLCHFIALRTIKGFQQKHLTIDPIDYYSNLSEVLTGNVITGLFCFAVDITNYST